MSLAPLLVIIEDEKCGKMRKKMVASERKFRLNSQEFRLFFALVRI